MENSQKFSNIFIGSKIAAMVRALIGCGWFGIQTSIGGNALYQIFIGFSHTLRNTPYLGDWIGFTLLELFCYIFFWVVNMAVMYKGTGISH